MHSKNPYERIAHAKGLCALGTKNIDRWAKGKTGRDLEGKSEKVPSESRKQKRASSPTL